MGTCMEGRGAQSQGQGKRIPRLRAGYIQCTWLRSEDPSTNTQGFIYKAFYYPVEGPARSSTERVIAAVRLGRPRQDGIQDEPERTASRCQRNVFHLRRLLDTLRADEALVVLVGDQHPLDCVQVSQHPLFRFVRIIGNTLRDFQEDPGRAWAVLLMLLTAGHRIQPIDTEVVGLFHLDRTLDALRELAVRGVSARLEFKLVVIKGTLVEVVTVTAKPKYL